MNKFTPEQVATMLAQDLGGFDGPLNAWFAVSADGTVITATLRPQSVDIVPAQHFTAHVFAAEPPAPVADGPVELDVKLARELAYCDAHLGASINGWTVVSNTEGSPRRAARWWHMVIRDEQGRHYKATYLRGAEGNDPRPFDYDEPVFEPVIPVAKVVRTVEWATPASSVVDAPEVADRG